MSCLPKGSGNSSAARNPLKAYQGIPSMLVDPVTTDLPIPPDGMDDPHAPAFRKPPRRGPRVEKSAPLSGPHAASQPKGTATKNQHSH
jgi:hypothetical protein